MAAKNGVSRSGGLHRRAAVAALALTCACGITFTGCQDEIRGKGSSQSSTLSGILSTQDMGEVVFGIYRSSIADGPPSVEQSAQLAIVDSEKPAFVQAVNDIVNVRTIGNAGQTADALFALVDDGTFPALAAHAADTLEQLARDPQALDSLVSLLSTSTRRTDLPLDEVIRVLGRMFNYPLTEQLWRASAQLIAENDGVDANGNPNGEPELVQDLLALLRDSFSAAGGAQPSARITQAFNDLTRALVEPAAIRGTFDFGPPEWIVRVDSRGLATVATDPSGQLLRPFVDQNGDGLADVDANDRFVDGSGNAITRPSFGRANAPGFDGHGRALADTGAPLYVYEDAKASILALNLQLLGELIRRDVLGLGRTVLEAALGPVGSNGAYAAANPVVDLGWGLMQLLRPETTPRLLRAVEAVIKRDPDLAERVIVTLARGLTATQQATGRGSFASTRLSDPRMRQLIDDVLPLLDDMFEPQGGTSTARTIADTMAQLRTTAPNFGPELAALVRFHTVEREQTPDADRNRIDESRSTAVDFSQPSFIGTRDNRSALQRLLALLARADGCSILGQNLAEMILSISADQTPATVSNLVGLLNALPGFLPNLFCSGISNDLAALDDLAKSGGLDALLPLSKAFKDRGQIPLMTRLLVRLSASYETVIRPLEPDLANVLESGAVDALLELTDLARGIIDPVSGDSAADLVAELTVLLVDDDATTRDARGNTVPSLAHLLLTPLFELDRRVVAANQTSALDQLTTALSEVFLDRVTVSGQERLKNGSLIPLTAKALELVAGAIPATAADRGREVDQAQADLLSFAGKKDLATILSVLRVIDRSPSKALINQGLADLLTPRRTANDDIFGALSRVLVILLQKPPSFASASGLTPFLARVLDPQNPLVPSAVRAFQRLLTADQGKTVLNVLRAAFNPRAGDPRAPAAVLIDIVQRVDEAGGPGASLNRTTLAGDVRAAVEFIRDDVSGLEWIFNLIRARQVR